jgi:ABC-type dipeptide/oligopeptide/nickel transport system ATPase component
LRGAGWLVRFVGRRGRSRIKAFGELRTIRGQVRAEVKKIDLHIHTVPTVSDSHFDFSLETFKGYVKESKLDAVAITNHDVFERKQFQTIKDALGIIVFPGIEINLKSGHLLLISNGMDLDDFESKTYSISKKIIKIGDSISISELKAIFGNLDKYLLIPHYEKHPPVSGQELADLLPYISAGEVDSAKKFIRTIKDSSKLTPVLFSDSRMSTNLEIWPTRQTFIHCGELTIDSIKACLRDKAKVSLSEKDGNKLYQIFEDGQMISTGLNILLGERSSGKTYTLNRISGSIQNTKYIKQFSLVQQDESSYAKEFNSDIQRKRSTFADNYLSGLKNILDDVMTVDLQADDRRAEAYLTTLLQSAEEADKRDAYSKTSLFGETESTVGNTKTLEELIGSVRQVIENIEFKVIIEKHLDTLTLKRLACELIELLWDKNLENKKKRIVNELVNDIKQRLKMRTSATQVKNVDFYELLLNMKKASRFNKIVALLKKDSVVSEENIQGFRIEARKGPFSGAGEIKAVSGAKTAFSDAFRDYSDPYKYLQTLLANDSLTRSELYKLFVKINFKILNKDGAEVSGGERSEFRLLQEINDAQNFDMLLIDEPESSFDNLFLKSDVNHIIKKLSESMPVVIVTHNSTVGASVGADFLLYAKKITVDGIAVYKLYSGYPTDKNLISPDGHSIRNHEVVLNSLEAGLDAYEGRRVGYDAIKN